mmetsp:Transcript_16843/g.43015  ORF Transcript_16843/g.43015 Transcript_16843/m.43015 type:complete len:173 (+) Transcript_16843:229-747(+)
MDEHRSIRTPTDKAGILKRNLGKTSVNHQQEQVQVNQFQNSHGGSAHQDESLGLLQEIVAFVRERRSLEKEQARAIKSKVREVEEEMNRVAQLSLEFQRRQTLSTTASGGLRLFLFCFFAFLFGCVCTLALLNLRCCLLGSRPDLAGRTLADLLVCAFHRMGTCGDGLTLAS